MHMTFLHYILGGVSQRSIDTALVFHAAGPDPPPVPAGHPSGFWQSGLHSEVRIIM